MSCVIGAGYVGPVEPLCHKLQVDYDELELILEEVGLTLFELEDDRVFITAQGKYQIADEVCITLDERGVYTPEELNLIEEYTGSTNKSLKVCRLAPEEDHGLVDLLTRELQ